MRFDETDHLIRVAIVVPCSQRDAWPSNHSSRFPGNEADLCNYLSFGKAARAEELHGKQCEGARHFKAGTADEYWAEELPHYRDAWPSNHSSCLPGNEADPGNR